MPAGCLGVCGGGVCLWSLDRAETTSGQCVCVLGGWVWMCVCGGWKLLIRFARLLICISQTRAAASHHHHHSVAVVFPWWWDSCCALWHHLPWVFCSLCLCPKWHPIPFIVHCCWPGSIRNRVAFRTYSLSLPKQPFSTNVILDSTIVNILSQTDLIIEFLSVE